MKFWRENSNCIIENLIKQILELFETLIFYRENSIICVCSQIQKGETSFWENFQGKNTSFGKTVYVWVKVHYKSLCHLGKKKAKASIFHGHLGGLYKSLASHSRERLANCCSDSTEGEEENCAMTHILAYDATLTSTPHSYTAASPPLRHTEEGLLEIFASALLRKKPLFELYSKSTTCEQAKVTFARSYLARLRGPARSALVLTDAILYPPKGSNLQLMYRCF